MDSRALTWQRCRRRRLALLAVLAAAGAFAPGSAAGAGAGASAGAAKIARALRAVDPPRIDGELNDPIWAAAEFVSDFAQREPVEHGAPSQRTEVAFAFDGDALYVAARMFTAGPSDVEAVMTRRDDTGAAERIIISLDTFRDRRTAYSFAVTAAGVRADWLHPDDATFPRDHSYDPVWEAAVRMEPDRWTAEMRIPFSQLRFRQQDEVRWGLNINRFIPHRNEDIFWIVVPREVQGWSSYFGELQGIRDIRPARRFELLPYAAGDATVTSSSLVDPMDPFSDELGFAGRAGMDLKVGLGPSLTLDATVNPDFGQVEADPAVVNLTAFESAFEERRPFFVEGARLLSGGAGPSTFYSRRIGAPPRGSAVADYAESPASTRILGAAKLTGRLPSRLSIGGLTALTQKRTAATFDLATGERGAIPVEPLTTYNVVRLEQEFGSHSSRIGGTLTGVYRDLDDPALETQFARYATTGVADANLRLADASVEVFGAAGFSAVGGEAAAISALQLSSTHYFQRPDQSHVAFDPDRTSLLGWNALAGARKRSGNVRAGGAVFALSPGFDLNDAGLLFAADEIGVEGGLEYFQTSSTDLYQSWNVGVSSSQEWNFGGARHPLFNTVFGTLTFPNFWRVSARKTVRAPGLDDRATRGGPLVGVGWGTDGSMSFSNSFSSRTQWSTSVDWRLAETGATGAGGSASLTMRPLDRLQLLLSPGFFSHTDSRQFVATVAGGDGATFGARYLFASIQRRELRFQTRLQLALSPDLALELYAEPFASTGRFSAFGELPSARSRNLRLYGDDGTTIERGDGSYTVTDGADSFDIADPDFTVLSLRSTLVLRWEFRPGSSLFVVWQQSRGDRLGRALGNTLAAAGDSFASPGAHTLALKLTYWLPVF